MRVGPSISNRLRVPQRAPKPDSGVTSEKTDIVDSMVERGWTAELKGVSPGQLDLLRAGFSKVDRGVLRWAEDQGVKLKVLQEGENLESTGALRDLGGHFENRIKADTVQNFHQILAPLTEKIANEKNPQEALKLRRQKRRKLAEFLTENPSGAAVFTPSFAPLLAPGLSSLQTDPTETPTLQGMALHHGADTPEEQSEFYRWMEMLNGERLEEARQASIKERSLLLASRPDAQKRWLKQAEEHPETIPLDTTLHTVVVPDAHFLPSLSDNSSLLLDRSDIQSVEGWRKEEFRGQWFFLEGKTEILIRDSAVGLDTPVHELGHVIDMTLEQREPEFYQSLRPKIEAAHAQARLDGKPISNYALANRREYMAEGFTA